MRTKRVNSDASPTIARRTGGLTCPKGDVGILFYDGNIMEDPNAGSFSQEPLPTTPSPPSGLPPDLQLALATYKTNYAKYQAGGQTQPAHKTAYEAALAVVNEAIATMNSATASNDTYIQDFISSYENTNQDITSLQTKSRDIQAAGPALQNKLAQSQQLHSHTVAVADETSLYVKSAIVFGLLIVAGIVGSL